jgi:glycosyltransferase involved in cell wall biosynthesis
MKLSIITVSCNAEASIGATLKSVAAQTHPDIEHIVIDGASTDGTLERIAADGGHIAQLVSEPDKGIYDAMNKGIQRATGEVIGILNADDCYADNEVLARVARIMESEPIDVVYADVVFFAPDNPTATIRRYSSRYFSPERIAWGQMPAHPTLFLRRSVFDRFGLYRTDYRISGDYEFVARIFKEGSLRYRYLPEVLVRMRIGGISTGGWRNTLLLNREVLRACRENGIKTSLLRILSKYPAKLFEFLMK